MKHFFNHAIFFLVSLDSVLSSAVMEEELRDRMGDIFDLENDVVGYPDSSSESGNDWES